MDARSPIWTVIGAGASLGSDLPQFHDLAIVQT